MVLASSPTRRSGSMRNLAPSNSPTSSSWSGIASGAGGLVELKRLAAVQHVVGAEVAEMRMVAASCRLIAGRNMRCNEAIFGVFVLWYLQKAWHN